MDPVTQSILHVLPHDSPYITIVRGIPPLSPEERKQIMTLIRVQEHPDVHPRLKKEFLPLTSRQLILTEWRGKVETIHGQTYVTLLGNSVTNSFLFASFLSSYIRSISIGSQDVVDLLLESISKEIDATQEIPGDPVLNYSVILPHHPGAGLRNAFNPYTGPNPLLAIRFRHRLREWFKQISDRVLLPNYKRRKVLSSSTTDASTSRILGDPLIPRDTVKGFTSLDLERHYSRTGETLGGVAEMKQAWKTNDLKPRTYYNPGGENYFNSRYVQKIMMSLVDFFPSSNRRQRFALHEMGPVLDYDYLVVYDYSSYTTRLTELRYFIEAIAEAFDEGQELTVLDTFYGITTIRMSELLRSYNVYCNIDPSYTYSGGGSVEEYTQRMSGFLGVHGNIAIATVLHGINTAFLAQDDSLCKVVGDDGLVNIVESASRRSRLKDFVQGGRLLGELSEKKVAHIRGRSSKALHGWHFTKRPIWITGVTIAQGILLDFPILAFGFKSLPNFVTKSPNDLGFAFLQQWSRFLDSIRSKYMYIDRNDLEIVFGLVARVYHRNRWPYDGSIGHISTSDCRFIPPARFFDITRPWLEVVYESCGLTSMIDLPIVPEGGVKGFEVDLSNRVVGSSFICTDSKVLRLLVDLQYLERSPRYHSSMFEASELTFLQLQKYYSSDLDKYYSYSVIEDLPVWLDELLGYDTTILL